MFLKAVSYEAVVDNYIYRFGFVPFKDKKWVVYRQPLDACEMGQPYEVLRYADNALTWATETIWSPSWMFDERTAAYEQEQYAAADVEALLSGKNPVVCTRNKGNSPASVLVNENDDDDEFDDEDEDDEYDDDEDDDDWEDDEDDEEEDDEDDEDDGDEDRKSTRLNSSHTDISRMPSSA